MRSRERVTYYHDIFQFVTRNALFYYYFFITYRPSVTRVLNHLLGSNLDKNSRNDNSTMNRNNKG